MTEDKLKHFADSKNCKWLGNGMGGCWQGYPFVTRLHLGRLGLLTTVFTISGRLSGQVCRRLNRELPRRCFLTWGQTPTLICRGRGDGLLEAYAAAMDRVTSALREENITVPRRCPYCKKGSCDALALTGRTYTPVHAACCEERSHTTAARAARDAKRGNYVTGAIGAVLGGLVAALPSFLTIWFLARIYSILFFLIPLGAYYGYRLLRGRVNRYAGVIIILVALITPFFLEQAVFYLTVATTYDILPSVFATTALYFSTYTPSQLANLMLIPYVFLLVGLWVTFQQFTHTSAHEAAIARAVLDSMTPHSSADSEADPQR